MAKDDDLLGDIESGAHDARVNLADVLRLCIKLGGLTGSEELRDWASKELKGYGPDDEVPSYRVLPMPLFQDRVERRGIFRHELVPMEWIPPDLREIILGEDLPFRQPIAEIEAFRDETAAGGTVDLAPAGSSELVALMNTRLEGTRIERVYWSVTPSTMTGILDVVRTTLVELVAEMRAASGGRPGALPGRDETNHAVAVAVHGNRARVFVAVQSGDGAVAAGRDVTVGPSSEPRSKWWLAIVGVAAAVVGAAATVWAVIR